MKRKILTTSLLLCSFIICYAAINDLTGKWKGTVKISDENELTLTYQFKVDGEKLTGSVLTPQGELPMYDGTLAGNNFTFKVNVGAITVMQTGKYYGDSVIVTADVNGETLHTTLKRADK
ncbi:MAG: glycoside hydrolase [Mucilaginibacter sp.]|nr:glycoside hydrolase [Mucilaginibacter sp.]